MDAEGYLATQHYPMDMNSTEGKSPCVCDLRASSGGGRVRLTFVELQLGSESSHVDPAACQRERSKQYVQLRSSYGMSTAYYLCAHRYNVEPEPSQVYKIIFENPVAGRRVGKLWIEYAGERASVKVSAPRVAEPAGFPRERTRAYAHLERAR